MKALARLILIIDFTFVSKVIGLVPLVGRLGALVYMCIIDSYYFFESVQLPYPFVPGRFD
jgi:etoposide-induced 2.4 mRNA